MDNFYHLKNGEKIIKEVLAAPELTETAARQHISHNTIVFHAVSFSYNSDTDHQEGTAQKGNDKKIALRTILQALKISILSL